LSVSLKNNKAWLMVFLPRPYCLFIKSLRRNIRKAGMVFKLVSPRQQNTQGTKTKALCILRSILEILCKKDIYSPCAWRHESGDGCEQDNHYV